MRLSVIICVYNTRREYLDECLDSLILGTCADFLEVILVDDGSDTDFSEYESLYGVKYTRIENSGQLAARLHGISLATGDYIAFLDSDDTVSQNYHLPMLRLAECEMADIVVGDWAFRTERALRTCGRIAWQTGVTPLRLFTSQRGRDQGYFVLWNKIYRTSLLRAVVYELEKLGLSGIRLTYGEDVLINFFAHKMAKSVKNVNSGFYFYRIHADQSVNITSRASLKNQIESISRVLSVMEENIGDTPDRSDIFRDISEWRALMARAHYSHAKKCGSPDLYPLIREKYSISRLVGQKYRDGATYASSELLGDNFPEIDSSLTEIYFAKKPVSVSYPRECRYISRIISDTEARTGKIKFKKNGAEYSVPAPKISITHRLIHQRIIYSLGMLLFPKGSRARALLKRRL